MRTILFFSIGSHIPEARFYALLARQLRAAQWRVVIATLSRTEYIELGRAGERPIWMREALRAVEPQAQAHLEAERARISAPYGLPSLRSLWSSDNSQQGSSTAEMEQKTVASFLVWEGMFARLRPDVVISDFGGELMRRALRRVAGDQQVPHIYLDWSPIAGTVGLHGNEVNHWDHMQVLDAPLEPEAQAEVDAYLEQVRAKRLSAVSFWSPEVTPGRVRRLARELWREHMLERGLHDQYTPTRWFREYLTRLAKLPLVRRRYVERVPGERYFFFPLHHAADAQLTIRAPGFLRQEFLIDWIARALPDGYKLYIKEHPRFIARYGLDIYRRFANTPNVRLISPYIHPHECILGAEAVVTINSTAGFEALLYHKPVVVIGPVSYRGYGATVDVDDINRLPEYLHRAVSAPPPAWKIDRFLWSMKQASYPGKLYDFSDANIATLAGSLLNKIAELDNAGQRAGDAVWSSSPA
jgi:hypothetical protein